MPSFKLTPIKPKGKLFDIPRIEKAVRTAMREVAQEGKELLEGATATWKHQPDFTTEETKDGIIIGTDDPIFAFVDEGTKPHDIRPKNKTLLRFRGGYGAKSSPGQLRAKPGGVSGGVVFAKVVHHPGTEAREFTEQAHKLTQNLLPVVVAQHLDEALGGD